MTGPIRLLIADDDELMRAGLRVLLQAVPGLEVVGEAVDGGDAVRQTVEHDPDVVLMDVRMPGMSGIEATAQLARRRPDRPRVLVVTTFEHDDYVLAALQSGASGFVLKRATRDELVRAVQTVHAGESLVYPRATLALLAEGAPRRARRETAQRVAALTSREREVLIHLAAGESNAEIARALVVTHETVKSHVRAVLGKLDARDRTQAVILAYEAGLAPRAAGTS